MKYITVIFFGFIFLVTAIVSCSEANYSEKIVSLDSLQTLIGKAKEDLKNMDINKADEYYKEMTKNLEYIQLNYHDTMDKELALFLSDYRSTAKPLQTLIEKNKELTKDISYSGEQIKNLAHDMKNQSIEPDKAEKYYMEESTIASQLMESVKLVTRTTDTLIFKVDRMRSRVTSMVDSLKKK